MESFGKKQLQARGANIEAYERPPVPFVGTPNALSLPVREELVYRYQFLEESTPLLASEYGLSQQALKEWLDELNVDRMPLETQDELANFETHVNETYKNIRTRLSGLIVLRSARNWEMLAKSEEDLLHSLNFATIRLLSQVEAGAFIDVKDLNSLVNSHGKLVERQKIIQNAIEVPAKRDMENTIDAITKRLEDVLDEIDGTGYKLPSDN